METQIERKIFVNPPACPYCGDRMIIKTDFNAENQTIKRSIRCANDRWDCRLSKVWLTLAEFAKAYNIK